ncbi:MAG: fibronectin type III domain-containing protein [Dehalogenimonas sp.]|uniref:Fibronectin type III domain-containing protein n=1 Tax=Candidatus Dehalogenimonas loeffleri TaxID=3127115 RepID=A0ABZ2JBQ7_9CHLR|nr:fibronectin type III domain-containing protein [Dehalogenimonas sp.]
MAMLRTTSLLFMVSILVVATACSSVVPPQNIQNNQQSTTVSPITSTSNAPLSPSELNGQLNSNTVFLSWRVNSTDETGFKVYRNGTLITTLPAKTNTYQDAGLTLGTSYTYQVRAFNEGGESGAATFTLNVPAMQAPSPPSNLVALTPSSSSVSLQWSDNSSNESGFRVYRDGSLIGTVNTNTNIFPDKGLQPGKTYTYIVKAYNSTGESGGASCIAKTPNPPMNITLEYAVLSDNKSGLLTSYLGTTFIVLTSDGVSPPHTEVFQQQGIYFQNYMTQKINQTLWHTDRASENVRVSIMAVSRMTTSPFGSILASLGSLWANSQGIPVSASDIQQVLGPTGDQLVGYYDLGLLNSTNAWGIGQQFKGVGYGDIKLWLSVWSETQPALGATPIVNPSVKIGTVDGPTQILAGNTYSYTVTLVNTELHQVDLVLTVESTIPNTQPVTQQVAIGGNSSTNVTFNLRFDQPGARTLTFSLAVSGRVFQSSTKSINASGPLSIVFDGWYVSGAKVTSARVGQNVTAKLTVTGGAAGAYTLQIYRDISLFPDQLTKDVTFTYNGNSTTIEITFTPNVASGYHYSLTNGISIWSQDQPTYPPRLQVTD